MRFTGRLAIITACCGMAQAAEPAESLRQSVQSRQPRVMELIAACRAQEGDDGVLRALAAATAEDRRLIASENADRGRVWDLIAAASHVAPREVSQMFAGRAVRRNPAQCSGDSLASCLGNPAPQPADATRLLVYLKQGIRFAQARSYQNALREFEQVLRIDPEFPGARKNIGSATLRLRQYNLAAKEFQKELETIGCLSAQSDSAIQPFCYFVEPGEAPAQVAECRRRLDSVRAATYYSQACLFSLLGDIEKSLDALQRAREAGFNDKRAIATDPDLRALRASPRYRGFN